MNVKLISLLFCGIISTFFQRNSGENVTINLEESWEYKCVYDSRRYVDPEKNTCLLTNVTPTRVLSDSDTKLFYDISWENAENVMFCIGDVQNLTCIRNLKNVTELTSHKNESVVNPRNDYKISNDLISLIYIFVLLIFLIIICEVFCIILEINMLLIEVNS